VSRDEEMNQNSETAEQKDKWNTESSKFVAFLKKETIFNIVICAVMKFLIAGGVSYLVSMFRAPENRTFAAFIIMFLVVFAICSLSVVALRLSKNLIVALLLWVVFILAAAFLIDRVGAAVGRIPIIANILLFLVLLIPIAVDVLRVLRLRAK